MRVTTIPGTRRYASSKTNMVVDVLVLPSKLSELDISNVTYRQALWASSMLCDIPLVTILGAAGTGKSMLLQMVYETHLADGDTPLVLAPTGVAVDNLRDKVESAYTFNRRFLLQTINWHAYRNYCGTSGTEFVKHFKPLLGIRTILIDEVGMTSCNMLDYVLDYVNDYNRHCPDKWIKVVLFGDVLQIPPVVTFSSELERNLWKAKYGDNEYFFNSVNWRSMTKKTFVLQQIHRQNNDWFKGVINRIREGKPTHQDLIDLNRRVMSIEEFMQKHEKSGYVHLAYTNKAVEEHNSRCIEQNMGKCLADAEGNKKDSKRVLSQTYSTSILFTEQNRTLDHILKYDFPSIPSESKLFVGMQVICIANHYKNNRDEGKHEHLDKDYFNGNLGVIKRFEKHEDPESGCERYLPIVDIAGRGETIIYMHSFVKSELRLNEETGVSENVDTLGILSIGCKPAYAMTYHKSQSLTLPAVYLDLDSLPQGYGPMSPTPSLVYLGLSRVRTFADIGLSRPMKMEDILISDEVRSFLEELPSIMEAEDNLDLFQTRVWDRQVEL